MTLLSMPIIWFIIFCTCLVSLQSYVAEIAENSQRGTPVNFVGGGGGQAAGIPEVFDHDAGSNGTFRLFLRDDLEGMFEVRRTKRYFSYFSIMYPRNIVL